MTISLLCPNGHRLICPDQQAGKRGKCPQCGATFRVPDVSGSSPSNAPPSGSSPSNNPFAASNSGVGSSGSSPILVGGSAPRNPAPVPVKVAAPEPAPTPPGLRPYNDGDAIGDDELAFLCPQGHHLCGPASLGGEPGECPVCHTRFLVPGADEEEVPEPTPAPAARSVESPFDFSGNGADNHQTAAPANGQAGRSLAEMFDSFWAYKAEGAIVELHLQNGDIVSPGGYAPDLSRGAHAVFMVRDANGTHTLAAIRWDSISHIAVRGVRQLPEGLFDIP